MNPFLNINNVLSNRQLSHQELSACCFFSMRLTLEYLTSSVGTTRTLKLLTCCDTLGFSLADHLAACHATNTN